MQKLCAISVQHRTYLCQHKLQRHLDVNDPTTTTPPPPTHHINTPPPNLHHQHTTTRRTITSPHHHQYTTKRRTIAHLPAPSPQLAVSLVAIIISRIITIKFPTAHELCKSQRERERWDKLVVRGEGGRGVRMTVHM